MDSAHRVSGTDRSVRQMGPASKALAIAALVLALSLSSGCGPSGEDPSQGTGATTIGAPVSSEPGGTSPASTIEVSLLRVVDGDTIWVRMPDGTEEKVRYIGIDAPEVASGATGAEYLGESGGGAQRAPAQVGGSRARTGRRGAGSLRAAAGVRMGGRPSGQRAAGAGRIRSGPGLPSQREPPTAAAGGATQRSGGEGRIVGSGEQHDVGRTPTAGLRW